MTIGGKAEDATAPDEDIRPNLAILLGGAAAIALVSAASLSPPLAIAASVLGALMVAGAEVDARTFLLPDLVTYGTLACGLGIAPMLDPFEPWAALGEAALRAFGTAFALALLRWCYGRLRGREGVGLGDVKLAAGIGAWLPLDAIPLCFSLAAVGALVTMITARLRGHSIDATTKIPLGAFLCPALWLAFYASVLRG